MRVYISGSSKEISRVKDAAAMIEESCIITHRWWEIIEARHAEGKTDADLNQWERAQAWDADIAGVEHADLLWYLVPNEGVSEGAAREVERAICRGLPVVASGAKAGSHICHWMLSVTALDVVAAEQILHEALEADDDLPSDIMDRLARLAQALHASERRETELRDELRRMRSGASS